MIYAACVPVGAKDVPTEEYGEKTERYPYGEKQKVLADVYQFQNADARSSLAC